MTKSNIEAVVNDIGGVEKIVGFRCANGTKFYFSRYALSLDHFVNMDDMEMLKLFHTDTMGNKAVSYLDISEIVQLYTIEDATKPIILRDILD